MHADDFALGPSLPLPARDELLEPQISAQRIERRVDLQPRRRQVVRDLQKPLQDVERPLVLAGEDVDAREEVPEVRAGEAVLLDRDELRAPTGSGPRVASPGNAARSPRAPAKAAWRPVRSPDRRA